MFSIAFCTYNGAEYLPAQLESILSQTLLPGELVVGDDGSTDATVSVIESFAATAPFPVRLHINDCNLGSTTNFERTILRCQGDIIAPCDQDDVWLPMKLSKLKAALDLDPNVGLVFSDAELVSEGLAPLGHRLWEVHFRPDEQNKFLQGQWLDVLLTRNVVTGATMAFRSAFCDLICPMPKFATLIHDGWIALAIGAFAKLAFVSEPLILYRQHPRQQLGVVLNTARQAPVPRLGRAVIRKNDYAATIDLMASQLADLDERITVLTELKNRNTTHTSSAITTDTWRTIQRNKIAIQDVILHYQVRGKLSSDRARRIVQVMQELLSRRYHRYSRGVVSAVKDIVARPAKPDSSSR